MRKKEEKENPTNTNKKEKLTNQIKKKSFKKCNRDSIYAFISIRFEWIWTETDYLAIDLWKFDF